MYEVTGEKKIDWNCIGLSYISEQMDNFMRPLPDQKIYQNISTVKCELSTIRDKSEITDQYVGSIGATLKNIDDKTKEPRPDS
jgi:hypothetical protein